MHIIGKVQRIVEPTPKQFLDEYVKARQPVIIEGMLKNWRALDAWTPEYVSELFGDRTYQFKSSSCNAHPDFRQSEIKNMFIRERLTFAQFFERITTGPVSERNRLLFSGDEHFLYRIRDGVAALNPELAEFWPDVAIPDLIPQENLYSVWAWFSGLGVRTWLHYDNNACHNINAQISGSKRAWLFPPSELEKVAIFPLGGPNPAVNCSQIDVDAPDLERFPDFATAKALEAELKKGDLLFIPVHWFHTFVHTGELNSNVNFWWTTDMRKDDPVARRDGLI